MYKGPMDKENREGGLTVGEGSGQGSGEQWGIMGNNCDRMTITF